MIKKAISEKCKNLANMLGFEKTGYLYYVDEFESDLQILYRKKSDISNEMLYVWFGGVLVLYNGTNNSEPKFTEGIWISLVDFLNKYYLSNKDSTLLSGSHSMLFSCKREAQKNRELIGEVLEYCIEFISNNECDAEKRVDEKLYSTIIKKEINGNKLHVIVDNYYMKYNVIAVIFNNETVFSYHFDSLTADCFNDEKCSVLNSDTEWLFNLFALK